MRSPKIRKPVEYVTTSVAAKACGASVTAVKQWIRQGKLRAIRTPGGHFRIPVDEIARITRLHGGDHGC